MKVLLPPMEHGEPVEVDLRDRMRAAGIPAVSIAVFQAGEILQAESVGVIEWGTSATVTPNTLFQAGSISKVVTAVAALRLVEEGELALDADINGFLRTWKVPPAGSWQPRITLRHLLSHTGGTTVHGFTGYRRGEPTPTLKETLDGAFPAKNGPVRVNGLPGMQFRYSGGGTSIVQMALMDVTGKPFADLMKDLVLAPLGMTASTFAQPLPPDLEPHAASGHWTGADVAGGRYYVHPELAAAGLWTTPSDLARLAIGIQTALAGGSSAILRRDTVNAMLTPGVAPQVGLGPFLSGQDGTSRWEHSGDTYGFYAHLATFKETGQGAAIMMNALTGSALMADILRTLARNHDWPALRPVEPPVSSSAPGAIRTQAGTYRLPSGRRLMLRADGGQMSLRMEDQAPVPLRVSRNGVLVAPGLDLAIQIITSRSVLLLCGSEGTLEATRVE